MPVRNVIAVDGPSGTGKSTVARAVAARLGLGYLDTGAMYRAVTRAVLDRGVDPADGDAVSAVAEQVRLDVSTDPAVPRVSLDGRVVDAAIRTDEVTAAVSEVSAVPRVRRHLVAAQQALIGAGGMVVEGRDIGSVVVPDAPLKVFLTASAVVRAGRRARQVGRVDPAEVAATATALGRRDEFDSTRAASPLRPAAGAVVVDSTALTFDQTVDLLVGMARTAGVDPTVPTSRRT